jgi:hypothetical protein
LADFKAYIADQIVFMDDCCHSGLDTVIDGAKHKHRTALNSKKSQLKEKVRLV